MIDQGDSKHLSECSDHSLDGVCVESFKVSFGRDSVFDFISTNMRSMTIKYGWRWKVNLISVSLPFFSAFLDQCDDQLDQELVVVK